MLSNYKVPGLKGIIENEDGTVNIEIEEGMEEVFFNAFGLKVGDEEGLQKILSASIEEYIREKSGGTKS